MVVFLAVVLVVVSGGAGVVGGSVAGRSVL